LILADTSGLLALFNSREPAHDTARRAVEDAGEELVVSPFVLAELDYLVATWLGTAAELTVLRELSGGAYVLAAMDDESVGLATDVIENYRDQAIGLTDASLVVLADRYGTRRVLTLDHRHFRVLRTGTGAPFELLP